jgi:hypothetical protein
LCVLWISLISRQIAILSLEDGKETRSKNSYHLRAWNRAEEGPCILMMHDVWEQVLQHSIIEWKIQVHFKRATSTSSCWLQIGVTLRTTRICTNMKTLFSVPFQQGWNKLKSFHTMYHTPPYSS